MRGVMRRMMCRMMCRMKRGAVLSAVLATVLAVVFTTSATSVFADSAVAVTGAARASPSVEDFPALHLTYVLVEPNPDVKVKSAERALLRQEYRLLIKNADVTTKLESLNEKIHLTSLQIQTLRAQIGNLTKQASMLPAAPAPSIPSIPSTPSTFSVPTAPTAPTAPPVASKPIVPIVSVSVASTPPSEKTGFVPALSPTKEPAPVLVSPTVELPAAALSPPLVKAPEAETSSLNPVSPVLPALVNVTNLRDEADEKNKALKEKPLLESPARLLSIALVLVAIFGVMAYVLRKRTPIFDYTYLPPIETELQKNSGVYEGPDSSRLDEANDLKAIIFKELNERRFVADVTHSIQPAEETQSIIDLTVADEEGDGELEVVTVSSQTRIQKPIDFETHELETTLDFADVMLSYGRTTSAMQSLRDYLDKTPKRSIKPWLKLLETYRLIGLRDAFERAAESVHENFNVQTPIWSEEGDKQLAGEPLPAHFNEDGNKISTDLEEIPHISAEVQAKWGTQACQDYLRHLLADNRGGARSGFPVSVIADILLLEDVLHELLEVEFEAGVELAEQA